MKTRVYLAPYNDISLELSRDISFKEKYDLLGFIDKNKKGSEIVNRATSDFDFIFICSPNYFEEIYGEFLYQGIEKRKILFYIKKAMQIIDSLEMVNFYNYNIYITILNIKRNKNGRKQNNRKTKTLWVC